MLQTNRYTCGFMAAIGLTTVSARVFVYAQPGPSKPSTQAAAQLVARLPSPTYPEAKARVVDGLGKLPLSFEVNRGQSDGRVKFLSRGSGYNLSLTDDEAILTLHGSGAGSRKPGERRPSLFATDHLPRTTEGGGGTERDGQMSVDTRLQMKLVGANSHAPVTGLDELPGKTNYFIGNDPKKWRTGVPTYAKVRYESVYPEVDLVYYGNQGGQLEYDFVVAPGADPKKIAFEVAADDVSSKLGAHRQPLSRNANGDLIWHRESGEFRLQKPVIYQEDSQGRRRYIDGQYLLHANASGTANAKSRISFEVGAYDHSRALVIDPAIAYSTFLAGSTFDATFGYNLAPFTDPTTGHFYAYVVGGTCSSDFPTVNAFQNTFRGGFLQYFNGACDVFVTKFDPSASGAASVIYSTYLGGSGAEGPGGIAVDAIGNVYITGVTQSTDFPTSNAYQPAIKFGPLSAPQDAFLAKLSPNGSALMYSTYFGGSLGDNANGIALDSAGRAYIAGGTYSPDLPTVNSFRAFQGPYNDVYVATFDTTLSGQASLLYCTFLGVSSSTVQAVAVDGTGMIHVGASTTSPSFPMVNGFQTTPYNGTYPYTGVYPPGETAFYAKLNPSASGAAQLVYSTYLAGQQTFGVVMDPSGNTYLASVDLDGGFGWVTKMNSSLTGAASLLYSTSIGQQVSPGTQFMGQFRIAVDAGGNAFVVGSANPGLPLVNPVQNSANGVMQSTNAGQSWTGLTQGLTEFPIESLAVDVSTSPRTLYAGTGLGSIFSTTDGGLHWNRVFQLPNPTPQSEWCFGLFNLILGSSGNCVVALAVDSTAPANVYAGTSAGVYKSSDRGITWSPFNNGLSSTAVQGVAALALDGGTLYAGASDGLYILSSGASSWTPTALTADVQNIAIDPATSPHTLYTASLNSGIYKSTDGGATWVAASPNGQSGGQITALAVDSATVPSTLYGYDPLAAGGGLYMWKSVDGAQTWNPLGLDPHLSGTEDPTLNIYIDRTTTPSGIYLCDILGGIYRSIDGGNSWTSPLGIALGAMAVDATTANGSTPITLYAATSFPVTNAFIGELDPSGSTFLFSTYLGGVASNTYGTAIAVDSLDNIYVTGGTGPVAAPATNHFPTVNAFQVTASPYQSAFFTKIGTQVLPASSSGSVTAQVVVQTGALAVTFPAITGSTTSTAPTLTVTPLSSAETASFSLSNNLGAFDISTTATFTASSSNPVTLCFQALSVNDPATFSNLRLIHIVNGTPEDVTSSHDFSTRTLCGGVTSFSPFIVISPATPAITWNTPSNIVYGTALSGTQLNATTNVAGTFAYTPPAGGVLGTGSGQTLSVTFTPADPIRYTATTMAVKINVLPAMPAITWSNPANIIYGNALSSTQLNATANVPGTFAYTPAAGTVLGPGSGQTLSVTFLPADTTDYTSATKTVRVNVLYETTTCDGDLGHTILQPINADGSSVFKLGSTVPTKFRVCDAHGFSIGSAGTVVSYQLVSAGTSTGLTIDEQLYSTAADTTFRWDSTGQQWIFNQGTGKNNPTLSQANTVYVFKINLNDGTYIQFQYGLK